MQHKKRKDSAQPGCMNCFC